MAFGAEEVTDICGIQEWFNQFGHGGFVAELAGVAFDGAESGIVDDAVGQRCFADAWWTVEKDYAGTSGNGSANPF
jgi:hypothetical protein